MKFRKDENGANNTTYALVAVVAIVALLLAVTSGMIAINLPTSTDEYSEYVNRDANDVGIKIPITVKLTWVQTADTGSSRGGIDVSVKHKHASGDDKVPDATLITKDNFNTQVANVNDVNTIYSVNGNTFQCANITWNGTLTSVDSVNFGYPQTNYKVWTTASVHTPSTSYTNYVIPVQLQIDHYRKATDELLDSYTLTFGVYYKLPAYNEDGDSIAEYTYYAYIPFDSYALVQDIDVKILGYKDSCIIQWKEITTTLRKYMSIELLGITVFKVVWQYDTTISTNLEYYWQEPGPTMYSVDNSDSYGSHSYTYKVR